MNALLGDTFSRENNTHGSRFHDRDPQFASRILGAMTQSCYIGTRDIRSRVIRGLYCITKHSNAVINTGHRPDINTLRPRQNGRHFADDTFKRIFLKKMSEFGLKFH